MAKERSVWVWMLYRIDHQSEAFGAIRRCEYVRWTAGEAVEEVGKVADEMRIGRFRWDHVDTRTLVGRTELDYMAIVTSAKLPPDEEPD